jgi:hypothetical protein
LSQRSQLAHLPTLANVDPIDETGFVNSVPSHVLDRDHETGVHDKYQQDNAAWCESLRNGLCHRGKQAEEHAHGKSHCERNEHEEKERTWFAS